MIIGDTNIPYSLATDYEVFPRSIIRARQYLRILQARGLGQMECPHA